MFKSVLVASAAFGALAFGAAPALAVSSVSVISGRCVSVSDARGCLFDGNVAPNTAADIAPTYNFYNDSVSSAAPDIALAYLYKSDDAGFTGTMTGIGTSSGTWSTVDAVSFVAVKARNFFVLYKLAAPATSGNWSTNDIPFNRNPPAISHIGFFTTAGGNGIDIGPGPGPVPEPASWALMIAGFGMVGAALRRRKVAAAA